MMEYVQVWAVSKAVHIFSCAFYFFYVYEDAKDNRMAVLNESYCYIPMHCCYDIGADNTAHCIAARYNVVQLDHAEEMNHHKIDAVDIEKVDDWDLVDYRL